ncbi:hypothetical protein CMT92_00120 [Elizabethkingia anophelis]|nr:hypothetical protein [Elizabethkingia anophelis]
MTSSSMCLSKFESTITQEGLFLWFDYEHTILAPLVNDVHRQLKLYFEKAGKIYLITTFSHAKCKKSG